MDSQLNILLIDDNEIDIVVNTKLLKLANISEQITSFMTARDLIDYINDNLSVLITKQSIILLDIQMPEIDGFQCLEMYDELPQSFKDVCKVFMLSSSIDRNDIENAEANPNVIKVLEKPLDVYLLKRLIS